MPESAGKRRLTSTVVVSKSFRREQEKRNTERSKDKRERRYRVHHSSSDDEDERYDRGNRRSFEGRGRRRRQKDELDDNEEDDDAKHNRSRRFNERNWQREVKDNWRDRRNRDQVSSLNPMQPRRIVMERNLDMVSRGQANIRGSLRDRREVVTEINLNPTDVPRGKRYFLHDDREVPRRQTNFMSRARSRSPVWKHDKFAEIIQDDTNVREEAADTRQRGRETRQRNRDMD